MGESLWTWWFEMSAQVPRGAFTAFTRTVGSVCRIVTPNWLSGAIPVDVKVPNRAAPDRGELPRFPA